MQDHSQLDAVLEKLDQEREAALKRLFSFMSIESISTDPAYKDSCLKAAELASLYLEEAGFTSEVAATTGHPMVVGKYKSKENPQAPHILFYGHYDVQPVDPIEEWTHPPFEAAIIEDPYNGPVIHGRGSSDDKGQLLTFLEAVRAWFEVTGDIPLNITVLLEGEEECGSPSLDGFLAERGQDIRADFALICDTLQWDKDTPAITSMLRGLAGFEISIEGPNRDLHSGMYGGPALNPLRAMSKAIASLYDEEGRVTVPGFYDGVLEPDAGMTEQWKSQGFNEAEFLSDIGLKSSHGEKGYHVLEQLWYRPTVEVNGLWGGYIGPGQKTVIPSEAHAKLTCRLVAGQDPATVIGSLQAHLRAQFDEDIKVSFSEADGAPAVAFDLSLPQMAVARAALEDEFHKTPVMLGCGGSIPIVEAFMERLQMNCLLVGYGLNDDCIHAPDEKYNLSSFQKGARSFARMIAGFSALGSVEHF